MTRPLPVRPSLLQLKTQAKELLDRLRRSSASVKLADAQRMIAQEYGFPNWQGLHGYIDHLTDQSLDQLAETFRKFASLECHGRSDSYECWANRLADDRELLQISAFGRTPVPNLLFAAVHLLVLENPTCDLARYYASVDRDHLPAEAGWKRFRGFCLSNRQAIVRLMRWRTTQTNEVRRSAYLSAAFNLVWKMDGQKPLAIIELGASAGLNLCFDHYAFRIDGKILGNRASSLVLDVESRGTILPPIPEKPLPIAHRIGIDLRPIASDDAEGINWLNALVWPEHQDRRVELAAALKIAAAVPRQLIAGDAVLIFEEVLRTLPTGSAVCVFQTHTFNQIPEPGRQKIMQAMEQFAKTRPIYFVSRHHNLTLDYFGNSAPALTILAETDSHGRWIDWRYAG